MVKAARRGRPPRQTRTPAETREALLSAGVKAFTQDGFSRTGLEQILKSVGVPKGSFYHYFASKEDYGLAVLAHYDTFFRHLLSKSFSLTDRAPLARLAHFVEQAQAGMARYEFQRGCLVGNLGQEVSQLSDTFRHALEQVLQGWQILLSETLDAAKHAGELTEATDSAQLSAFFWIGWEGAILRARLTRSSTPMQVFYQGFMNSLPRPTRQKTQTHAPNQGAV